MNAAGDGDSGTGMDAAALAEAFRALDLLAAWLQVVLHWEIQSPSRNRHSWRSGKTRRGSGITGRLPLAA